MNEKSIKNALESIAQRGVPEDTNLWPAISARIERKSLMYTLRARPVVAILMALLVLLAVSGTAYALGKLLGYIPGLGVVDQNTPFQVLAEPVSQTQEGITVTVNEAISNEDQVLVAFAIKGIPSDKHSLLIGPDTCLSYPELHFPGGESVKVAGGTSNPLDGGYESRYKFAPAPVGASDAILFIPCIQGATGPGALPEGWELPLHFVPAPPDTDLNIIFIEEVTPARAQPEAATTVPPVQNNPIPEADAVDENPLSIVQVIDTGNNYIFVGAFTPPVSPSNEKGLYATADIVLRDPNGRAIEWQPAVDLNLTPYIVAAPGKDIWAVQFSKDFLPPLHITYRTQYLYSTASPETYTFELDAGTNPQPGQEWNLNQEFQLAGHVVYLSRIAAGANSLTFFFRTDDESVESLGINSRQAIQIEGYTPIDFVGSQGVGSWNVTEIYPEMPKGKLKITLSDLYLYGEMEDWQVDWQP